MLKKNTGNKNKECEKFYKAMIWFLKGKKWQRKTED